MQSTLKPYFLFLPTGSTTDCEFQALHFIMEERIQKAVNFLKNPKGDL